jgi:L-asparaginase
VKRAVFRDGFPDNMDARADVLAGPRPVPAKRLASARRNLRSNVSWLSTKPLPPCDNDLVVLIHLLTTGGTMEKIYKEQTGSVENIASKVDRYLERLRLPDAEVRIERLMNKDSLEMTAADRARILDVVRSKLASEVAPVVITHGTDTMVETGTVLQLGLPELAVPIILTGAMTPLGFESSDGLQNLTESLLAARLLPPGVYIVMHNQVFPIGRVRKDRDLARFVSTE